MTARTVAKLVLKIDFSLKRIPVPRGMVLTMAGYGWFPEELCAFGDVEGVVLSEDVMPDVVRLMKSVASSCTDLKNVSLHFDELLGELHLKLAQILGNKTVTWESRQQFFGFLKVSFQRHLKSTVQKHALTYKRTGVKPRKMGEEPESDVELGRGRPENNCGQDHCTQVAMDDAENGAQFWIGEDDKGFDDLELSDEIKNFIPCLTEEEKKVFFQEAEPNDKAMRLAMETSPNGRKSRKFRVLDRHKAEGIDMPVYVYKRNLERIHEKMLASWKFSSDRQREHYAAKLA